MGFPRQEYWSGLSFLPHTGIKLETLVLVGSFFITSATWEAPVEYAPQVILLCPVWMGTRTSCGPSRSGSSKTGLWDAGNPTDYEAQAQVYRSGTWALGSDSFRIWMFKASSLAWALGLAPTVPRALSPDWQFRRWSPGAPLGGPGTASGWSKAGEAERGVNRKSAAGAAHRAGGGRSRRPSELQPPFVPSLPTLCSSSWWVELPRSEPELGPGLSGVPEAPTPTSCRSGGAWAWVLQTPAPSSSPFLVGCGGFLFCLTHLFTSVFLTP